MKKIMLLLTFLGLLFSANAQNDAQEFISTCPEMQVGKVYTGEDIRASKKRFPKGAYFVGYGSNKQYRFAKITGKKTAVLLTFEDKYKGEIIYMHAYVYNHKSKNYELLQSVSYIYNDGKADSRTTYESTIELTAENQLIINEKENGRLKTKTYRIGKKRLEYE